MSTNNGIAHIPKAQYPDRFQAWCGLRINGFALVSLDHAAACLISGSRVTPCKNCIREAVAVLTEKKPYEPDPNRPKIAPVISGPTVGDLDTVRRALVGNDAAEKP